LDFAPQSGQIFSTKGEIEILDLVAAVIECMVLDEWQLCQCLKRCLDCGDIKSWRPVWLHLNTERFDHALEVAG